jgi:hypothetical protein
MCRPWQSTPIGKIALVLCALLCACSLLLLSGCQDKDQTMAAEPIGSAVIPGEDGEGDYSRLREQILREPAVRATKPNTTADFTISLLHSMQARKFVITQGIDMESVAYYFEQHPELGTGAAYLELNSGNLSYDERRVVVTDDLDLGDMRETVERLLKASPFDLTIYVASDAVQFRIHWWDTFGSPLTEDIFYLYGVNYNYGDARNEGFIRFAPYWYYREFVGVG